MRSMYTLAAAALSAVALGIAACSSTPTNGNNCGKGTPPDLSGSYLLSTYTLGSQTWSSPQSSGLLQMTASTYQYSMTLSTGTPPTQSVFETGSYQFVGATCVILTSSIDTTHFSGSIRVTTVSNVTTLRENGNDGTHVVDWVWIKN
ncbi:MAG TPA: hypothetical protein VMF70_09485 [Gemmatimonadales bacterium]|nr:hypothetical protein [Gemmatimonadales bacterium]